MQNVFITQYSIGFISPALLSLIISCAIALRLLKSRKFAPDKTSLALYFLGASIYNILNFLGFSIYSQDAQVIWYLESFTPFAVIFMVRFAYYYPSSWRETERKIVLISGLILSIAAISEYWINSWYSPVKLFGHTYGAFYHSSAIPLLVAVFYLWAVTVFIRRTIDFEKKNGTAGNILKKIIKPETREGKTARIFAGLILLDIIHSIIVYGGMNKVPVSVFLISFSTAIAALVIYSLYTRVYLHSAYDNIPFIYKLTGIPLVIILLLVTASGYMMMFFRSISYDEMNIAVISEMKIDERSVWNTGYVPVSYITTSKDGAWQVIYDKNGNMPFTINSGLWKDAPSGMQMKTGRGLEDFNKIESDRNYFIQIDGINYHQYNHRIGDKVYGFGIPYLDYLKYMHRTGRMIFFVMIVSILLIISLLPILYFFGVVDPLRKVIQGNSGETNPMLYLENEIHYIEQILGKKFENRKSKSFPEKPEEMSTSIKKKLDVIADYLKENYREDISREGLASMIDLDPDYISRLFKIYTGMRIGEYINNLRIEEASRLLISDNRSVLDICMLVGFESLRTFNRAFFRKMGETPSSFRNKKQ